MDLTDRYKELNLWINMTKKLPKKAIEFFQNSGREGGLKRASKLSKEQRAAIAKKAALKRWENRKPSES
jgi:hypothetical protein